MPASHPQVSYHFSVETGLTRIGFARVTLPRLQRELIRYREGSDSEETVRLLPGLLNVGHCVLERGVLAQDNELFVWLNDAHFGSAARRDVTVALLDQNHAPTRVWRLRNCFPVALDWSVLDAQRSEVLIERLELAVETLTVETA